MAVEFIAAVLRHSKAKLGARLVMVVLADKAGADGICFPSMETIAREALISRRQVARIIPKLVRSGEIEIVRQGGRGYAQNYANTYRVLVNILGTGGVRMSPPPDISGRNRALNVTPTVNEPSYKKGELRSPGAAPARPSSLARLSQAAIGAMIGKTKAEIRDIVNPCGRAYASAPTDPEKKRRCAQLQEKLLKLKAEEKRRIET